MHFYLLMRHSRELARSTANDNMVLPDVFLIDMLEENMDPVIVAPLAALSPWAEVFVPYNSEWPVLPEPASEHKSVPKISRKGKARSLRV